MIENALMWGRYLEITRQSRRSPYEAAARTKLLMLRQAANAPAEEELTQAVRRVHEHYGTDLNSFFRDILEQIRRNREAEPSQHEPASGDDQTAA